MTTMKLGELLTDEQIEKVLDIIVEHPNQHERIRALKQYLAQFSKELEAKGVISDFLAYVVEYLITEQQKDTHEG